MNILVELGESVFEWTWKTSMYATLLIVLVFVLQKFLARWLTPRLRYALSLLVLIRLLLPMAPASVLSLENLFPPTARLTKAPPFRPISTVSLVDVHSALPPQIFPISARAEDHPWRINLSEALCIVWVSGFLCFLLGYPVLLKLSLNFSFARAQLSRSGLFA